MRSADPAQRLPVLAQLRVRQRRPQPVAQFSRASGPTRYMPSGSRAAVKYGDFRNESRLDGLADLLVVALRVDLVLDELPALLDPQEAVVVLELSFPLHHPHERCREVAEPRGLLPVLVQRA